MYVWVTETLHAMKETQLLPPLHAWCMFFLSSDTGVKTFLGDTLHMNCYYHILIDHFSLEILCMLSSPRLQKPGLLQLVKALLCRATTFKGPNSNSLLPYFVYGPGNYALEISTHGTSSQGFSGIYSLQGKNTILKVKQQTAAAVISTHTYYR
jgi:hypothetical protein